MKVRDLITELLRMPMDDEVEVGIEVAQERVDVGIASVGRCNEGGTPTTMIVLSDTLTPQVTVSFSKE